MVWCGLIALLIVECVTDRAGERAARAGRVAGTRSGSMGVNAPSFKSAWVSDTPAPALLSLCRESRGRNPSPTLLYQKSQTNHPNHPSVEALKSYTLAFHSIESPSKILFNFDTDTLHFTGFDAYQLDLFLGGDYYGGSDAEKVKWLQLDVPEELYGRRGFCWGDLRGFGNCMFYLFLVYLLSFPIFVILIALPSSLPPSKAPKESQKPLSYQNNSRKNPPHRPRKGRTRPTTQAKPPNEVLRE